MLEGALEKAQELGRLLGQTAEYQALQRARERLGNDRDLVKLANRLAELEAELLRSAESGAEPGATTRDEYERTFTELQAHPAYQALVAAQSNFEKVLARVNDQITRGMEAGAQSRIILPS
ncbi:MAG: YlbF family regulator [Gemmatimonadetes bacterium]|nr:YlbF family regulator [Gemmatimonadota bacterium]